MDYAITIEHKGMTYSISNTGDMTASKHGEAVEIAHDWHTKMLLADVLLNVQRAWQSLEEEEVTV